MWAWAVQQGATVRRGAWGEWIPMSYTHQVMGSAGALVGEFLRWLSRLSWECGWWSCGPEASCALGHSRKRREQEVGGL